MQDFRVAVIQCLWRRSLRIDLVVAEAAHVLVRPWGGRKQRAGFVKAVRRGSGSMTL